MRLASLEVFARDAVGRWVSGPTYVHFCAGPDLWGLLLWGRPTEADARQLGRSLVLELAPDVQPHASIVDASRLRGADAGAFGAADAYLKRYDALLRRSVRRLALVRPSGLEGAVVAGAFEVMPKPYPVTLFEQTRGALAWLETTGVRVEPSPARFAELLSDVYAQAARTPALLLAMRGVLEARLEGVTISDVAAKLGTSDRTLQRKLRDFGTTFQAELGRARVESAKRLLLNTERPLTSVALDVGCASLQHLGALFRRHTGQSPSAWVAAQQRSSDERARSTRGSG